MKILLIRSNPHDVNQAVPRTLEAASAVFDDLRVICWNHRGLPLGSRDQCNDVPVLRFNFSLRYPGWRRIVRAVIGILWFQAWALGHILSYRPRVVQAFDFYAVLPAVLGRLLTGCKVVYDIRDPLALSFAFSPVLRRIVYAVDWCIMGLSSAIVVPDESRIDYLGRWGRRRPLVVVLNTCHDQLHRLDETTGYEPPPPGKVRIAFLGYIASSRGADMLLAACAGEDSFVEVWAAGSCSPAELEEQFKRSPGARWLGKCGWLDSLAIARSSSAVWIVYDPSVEVNRMAAPNKLYEALMLGTPVVLSEGMAQAHWVRREGLGLVIRYNDPVRLIEALTALRDPQALEQMRRRCRDYFLRHPTLERELKKYRRFYTRLLGASGAKRTMMQETTYRS
ncbi:MAG: hypothetical protein BWX88_00968 [Planctomycetes bacterium ADurb.Bin126]|nr:MAG: hypothetical protein BWX88_00968 [Planctomycetes bacterium ADurb.Bin126]HOD80985.1 glycosyltransferase [Phycisphaerae bacterium]HQL73334.1 glycosyltransferase [Phycisphaerae bacterium]